MKKLNFKIVKEYGNIDGFTVKPGYVRFENGTLSSGWSQGDAIFVYSKVDGEWKGDWESEDDGYPVSEIEEALAEWQEQQDLKEVEILNNPYLGGEFDIVTVVAGERCYNGGEFGFWDTYSPVPGKPGVYRVESKTTCDFDACGTGYEGFAFISVDEYNHLRREEGELLALGSQY